MHPLIDRLTTALDWPRLDGSEALEAHLATPGVHGLFVPGDPTKNLETTDAAVILPELHALFSESFDMAVIGDDIERDVRERFDTWPTPSLILVKDGVALGAIPKVRDWDDYIARARLILDGEPASGAAIC